MLIGNFMGISHLLKTFPHGQQGCDPLTSILWRTMSLQRSIVMRRWSGAADIQIQTASFHLFIHALLRSVVSDGDDSTVIAECYFLPRHD